MRSIIDWVILKAVSIKDSIRFPWNRWSKLVCKKMGVSFRDVDSVRFLGRCFFRISSSSTVSVGRGFICRSGADYSMDASSGSKIKTFPGAALCIGDNVGMSNTVIYCKQSVTIGNNVKIGSGCMIMDSNFHSTDWKIRRSDNDIQNAISKPVNIKDDVFIGARSIVCKGVTIGKRSMIAAGSVVVSDIPDDCIAGGNPCRVIRSLNDN